MNYSSLQKNMKGIYIALFFVCGLALFSPQQAWGACQLTTGQFRNFDYIVNFPVTWFINSIAENNTQPYVYLDLKFNQDCLNETVELTIFEEDTAAMDDPISDFDSVDFQVTALENTFIFKAGSQECNTASSPDCYYYFSMESEEGSQDYNSGLLQISYDYPSGEGDDYAWQYLGSVNSSNISGYSYGSYVGSNDPDFLAYEDEQSSLGTPDDEQSSLGTPDDEQSNLGLLTITEQIENPLGDGSTLPAFVESLLGIIIRAGIPLIVLAIIYTGFRFVYARGKPDEIKKAKEILLYTVIGTAIILGAWTIATILTNTVSDVIGSVIIHLV